MKKINTEALNNAARLVIGEMKSVIRALGTLENAESYMDLTEVQEAEIFAVVEASVASSSGLLANVLTVAAATEKVDLFGVAVPVEEV